MWDIIQSLNKATTSMFRHHNRHATIRQIEKEERKGHRLEKYSTDQVLKQGKRIRRLAWAEFGTSNHKMPSCPKTFSYL